MNFKLFFNLVLVFFISFSFNINAYELDAIQSEEDCFDYNINLEDNTKETFNLGDIGPAGGVIFLTPSCEGNNTGLYFETAPEIKKISTEGFNKVVKNLSREIGSGKNNTIRILNRSSFFNIIYYEREPEFNFTKFPPAKFCNNLKIKDGKVYDDNNTGLFSCSRSKFYNDYFLPSHNELYSLISVLGYNKTKGRGLFASSSLTAIMPGKLKHKFGYDETPSVICARSFKH